MEENTGNIESSSSMNNKKRIIVIIALVLIAIVSGVFVYFNTAGVKAKQALKLGAQYLQEMNYEQAVVEFQKAMDLDPKNSELADTVNGFLLAMLDEAKAAESSKDYDKEIRILENILSLKSEHPSIKETQEKARSMKEIAELLKQGNESFLIGKYIDTRTYLEKAEILGATEEMVNPNLKLSISYQKILDMCGKSDWNGVAKYIDSNEFDTAAEQINATGEVTVGEGADTKLKKIDGGYSVQYKGKVCVVSATNTYSVYEGNWSGDKPEGKGKLSVWNKNENLSDAAVMEGSFGNGILNGDIKYTSSSVESVTLTAVNGAIQVKKLDDNGNIWVSDMVDGNVAIAVNRESDGSVISNYIAGIPGHGGSDSKLLAEEIYLDVEPPEFQIGFSKGSWIQTWYPGMGATSYNIEKYKLKAFDNVDGDVTSKIKASSEKQNVPTVVKEFDPSWYLWRQVITYTVEDSSGNEAVMVITYEAWECDSWYIVDIQEK